MGLPDPHSYGSGNPGATNVLRTGNKLAAALTLVGDGAKGWLAVFLAQQLGPGFGVADWTVPAVALAAFLGHLFPVFHRFAGGKGVATAFGIMIALSWPLALAMAAIMGRDGARIPDQLARRADRRGAGADRRVLRFRQRTARMDLDTHRCAPVLAAQGEHRENAVGQREQDRPLIRVFSRRRGRFANWT